MKKYNFNAGPSMLPREVIENTAKQILDFNGCISTYQKWIELTAGTHWSR